MILRPCIILFVRANASMEVLVPPLKCLRCVRQRAGRKEKK